MHHRGWKKFKKNLKPGICSQNIWIQIFAPAFNELRLHFLLLPFLICKMIYLIGLECRFHEIKSIAFSEQNQSYSKYLKSASCFNGFMFYSEPLLDKLSFI
jgi:hypothetical protein